MHNQRKHWLHLAGIIVVSSALAACGGSTLPSAAATHTVPGGTQQPSAAAGHSNTITIGAKEFAFTLDPAHASTGVVTFMVTNEGTTEHDFQINGNGVKQKTTKLQPKQTASMTVDLPPGTYTYQCTVPGHADLGMRGTFIVQ